jgi:putative hydrolase of the HAD superfamily
LSGKKILLFDADGVVIEPWGFARRLEAHYGLTPAETRPFFTGPFQACLLGQSALDVVLPPFLNSWEWKETVDEFIRLWLVSENQPRAELMKLIADCRTEGFLCCLASNQEPVRAAYIGADMGFNQAFDRLYFSCDLGRMKPSADYYQAIQNDLGVEGNQILFWDDSPEHVAGATQAGWNAHLYKGMESSLGVLDDQGGS